MEEPGIRIQRLWLRYSEEENNLSANTESSSPEKQWARFLKHELGLLFMHSARIAFVWGFIIVFICSVIAGCTILLFVLGHSAITALHLLIVIAGSALTALAGGFVNRITGEIKIKKEIRRINKLYG